MAKKRTQSEPKAKRSKRTKKGDPDSPAQLYDGMMDEHSMLVELGRAEKRLREADRKVEEAKGDLKAARGEQHKANKALRDLAGASADGQKLVNPDAGKAKASPAADRPAEAAPTAGMELDWRTKRVTVLGLGKRLTEKLQGRKVETMGDLHDAASAGDLPAECKMSDIERARFGKACDDFYAKHKVGSYAKVATA